MVGFETVAGIVFTMIVGVAVGTDCTWDALVRAFRTSMKPFCVGVTVAFVFMPLYALVFTCIFESPLRSFAEHNYSSATLGIMVVGALPGGSTSNLFTYFVEGNVALSIVMSMVTNIASVGFTPGVLYLLYDLRFKDSAESVKIPYDNIIIPMLLQVLCIALGMVCKAYASDNFTWWVAKTCSCVSLFFLVAAIVMGLSKYGYFLSNGDWTIYLIALTVQPLGYAFGIGFAALAGCGLRDQMTIAFETGIQSFTMGMALAQLSFDQEKEEAIFVDVFKYSAICGAFYPAHCAWLTLLFRKFLPKGLRRVSPFYPDDIWTNYAHKPHTEASIQATGELVPVCPEPPSLGSAEMFPPTTLPELFDLAVKKHPQRLALAVERDIPVDKDGKIIKAKPWKDWSKYTYSQYKAEVFRVAAALLDLGLPQFGTVTINAFNAPEWSICSMGVIYIGAKVCGIYSTDTDENIIWKTNHTSASVAIIDNRAKGPWYLEKQLDMPTLKAVVSWEELSTKSDETLKSLLPKTQDSWSLPLHYFHELLSTGDALLAKDSDCVVDRTKLIKPGHCAALVYTSGTSGKPKAVMVSHDNLTFSAQMVTYCTRDIFSVAEGEEGRILSYLPLSHIAGFMLDVVMPFVVTSRTRGYVAVLFARKTDLRDGTMLDRLRVARPTIFFGVPRVWEKFEEKLKAIGAKTTGWFCCFRKKDLSAWSKRQALRTAENKQVGGSGRSSAFFGLAEAMVLNGVKAALGLDECRAFLSGAAPLSLETKRYFASLGMIVTECYGMSESCGMGLLCTDMRYHMGALGWRMPGAQVKLLSQSGNGEVCPAVDFQRPTEDEQGEICLRGRHVMMGYFMNQDLGPEHIADVLNQTWTTIDEDGWLHTGDKGCMSSTGLFRITGRFKELIIGAGGENVAPIPIENKIKETCPAISNVMMVGDHRKYNVVLVTLKVEGADGENPGTDQLAGLATEVNPAVKTTGEALTDKTWKEYIQCGISAANADQIACPNNASKVQKFAILPKEFSIKGGEFTPSLKLRRSVAAEIWKKEIDELYCEE